MPDPSFFTDGEAYERMMGPWSRAAGEVFLDWLALPPALRWLDVGCGTGAFTRLVLDRCGPRDLTAVDPAAEQIAYAQKTPAAKRTTFRLGDAQALPFDDGVFDVAVMALVISFLADPAKGLAEMRRVVKHGGTVAAYMWDFMGNRFTQWPLREAVEAMGIEIAPMPGHANSTSERLRALFAGAGLDQVETRPIEIEVSFADFDEYWSTQTALANSTVRHIRTMSSAEVERLKSYLREHLPRARGGRIAYRACANAVKGRVPG